MLMTHTSPLSCSGVASGSSPRTPVTAAEIRSSMLADSGPAHRSSNAYKNLGCSVDRIIGGASMAGISCAQLARLSSTGQRSRSGSRRRSLVPPRCATRCRIVEPPARPTRQQSSPGKASYKFAGEQCGKRTSAAAHSPHRTASVKADRPLSTLKSGETPVARRYLHTST